MAALRQLRDEFTRYWVEVPELPAQHRALVFEALRGLIETGVGRWLMNDPDF